MAPKNLQPYLANTEFINGADPTVKAQAQKLKGALTRDSDIAKNCFEYVRDAIKHSWDYKLDTITCTAEDVLKHQTGYCYAQSHLLAALLRANGIPAGLCYQRLSLTGSGAPYCLHGLNAVYLEQFGWYRIDPRGNKENVNAEFTPPIEQLAFSTNKRLEADIQGIFSEPWPVVVHALQTFESCIAVYENLPDVEVW